MRSPAASRPAPPSRTSGARPGTCSRISRQAFPTARLLGVDLVAERLAQRARARARRRPLLLADVCALPFADGGVDAARLGQPARARSPTTRARCARCARVLRPGGRAAVVVPAGPGTYDYYDRFLGHERRYGRGELAGKARGAGLEVLDRRAPGLARLPAVLGRRRSSIGAATQRRSEMRRRVVQRHRPHPGLAPRDGRLRGRAVVAPARQCDFRSAFAVLPWCGSHERHDADRPAATDPRTRGGVLSIVIPAYNEEATAGPAYERLSEVLDRPGAGRLGDHLLGRPVQRPHRGRDPRPARARSAGQDAALLAPLRPAGGDAGRAWPHASGDARVVIDCDLQDPPELIAEMVDALARGLRRRLRAAPHARGRDAAEAHRRRLGYRVIRRVAEVDIPPNTGDFRLMSRRVVDDVVRARRDARLPARPRRARRLPADQRALRPRPARRRRRASTTASSGSLVIGLNGIVGFSRYPLHADLAGRHRAVRRSRCLLAARLPRAEASLGVEFPIGNPTS